LQDYTQKNKTMWIDYNTDSFQTKPSINKRDITRVDNVTDERATKRNKATVMAPPHFIINRLGSFIVYRLFSRYDFYDSYVVSNIMSYTAMTEFGFERIAYPITMKFSWYQLFMASNIWDDISVHKAPIIREKYMLKTTNGLDLEHIDIQEDDPRAFIMAIHMHPRENVKNIMEWFVRHCIISYNIHESIMQSIIKICIKNDLYELLGEYLCMMRRDSKLGTDITTSRFLAPIVLKWVLLAIKFHSMRSFEILYEMIRDKGFTHDIFTNALLYDCGLDEIKTITNILERSRHIGNNTDALILEHSATKRDISMLRYCMEERRIRPVDHYGATILFKNAAKNKHTACIAYLLRMTMPGKRIGRPDRLLQSIFKVASIECIDLVFDNFSVLFPKNPNGIGVRGIGSLMDRKNERGDYDDDIILYTLEKVQRHGMSDLFDDKMIKKLETRKCVKSHDFITRLKH
jgi:hypothetical protein